jgi:hypothetical protein
MNFDKFPSSIVLMCVCVSSFFILSEPVHPLTLLAHFVTAGCILLSSLSVENQVLLP